MQFPMKKQNNLEEETVNDNIDEVKKTDSN